jgi:uncharacterized protein YidB (DUF937 family)
MDIASLIKIGAETFMKSDKSGEAGSGLDIGTLGTALSGLMGGGQGGIDLGSLMSKFSSAGLGNIVNSWLGDGSNASVSTDQIMEMFGSNKISEFASTLGLSQEAAAGGLSDAIPQMVDKASSGGSLLDSVGGLSGALGMAGKLFGK